MRVTLFNIISIFALFSSFTSASAQTWWQPHDFLSWDWQLTEPYDFTRPVQMIDLDLFETSPKTIKAFQSNGTKVICYINVGAWEDWRADAKEFPSVIIGKDYAGWEGEKWLDIRRIDLLAPIMKARMDLCAAKGFDGMEPDNMDLHWANTGFPISKQDQIRYSLWLANEAHKRGLSIGQKNAGDLASVLVAHFDWALTEDCIADNWCAEMTPYVKAGKSIFAAEYTDNFQDISPYCNKVKKHGVSLILKDRDLTKSLKICPD